MVLAKDLHFAPQLLNLCHTHDLAPLVVDLHAVDARTLLLTQLLLAQCHSCQLLQVQYGLYVGTGAASRGCAVGEGALSASCLLQGAVEQC
jgi:hypothetical protein